MTNSTTPFNLSFRSFGEDEVTSTEEIFLIDNNTIVFNQDIVATTGVDSSEGATMSINIYLKNGMTIKKTFSVTNHIVQEK